MVDLIYGGVLLQLDILWYFGSVSTDPYGGLTVGAGRDPPAVFLYLEQDND